MLLKIEREVEIKELQSQLNRIKKHLRRRMMFSVEKRCCNRPDMKVVTDSKENNMEDLLKRLPSEISMPVASMFDVNDKTHWYILDSGASSNVIGYDLAGGPLADYLRKLRCPTEYQTASEPVVVNEGVRMTIAPWDSVADFVFMKGSPSLLSTGGRCIHGGFSHIWVNKRFPVLISPGQRYIIIFDLDGVLPVYSGQLEDSKNMFGTFDLYRNAFRECAGIILNHAGRIELDLPALNWFMDKYGRRVDRSCPAVAKQFCVAS